MALVPLSVRRSMYTSSDRRRKVLNPAAAMARSRSARVVILIGSTTFTFHGSAHARREGWGAGGREFGGRCSVGSGVWLIGLRSSPRRPWFPLTLTPSFNRPCAVSASFPLEAAGGDVIIEPLRGS